MNELPKITDGSIAINSFVRPQSPQNNKNNYVLVTSHYANSVKLPVTEKVENLI